MKALGILLNVSGFFLTIFAVSIFDASFDGSTLNLGRLQTQHHLFLFGLFSVGLGSFLVVADLFIERLQDLHHPCQMADAQKPPVSTVDLTPQSQAERALAPSAQYSISNPSPDAEENMTVLFFGGAIALVVVTVIFWAVTQ